MPDLPPTVERRDSKIKRYPCPHRVAIFTKRLTNARKKKMGYEVHQSKGLINYPAVLLGRLGVDLRYQHAHLGPQIIDFVAQWFTSDDNKSGCRHLIVDAYNEPGLIDFYQRNGFKLFSVQSYRSVNTAL